MTYFICDYIETGYYPYVDMTLFISLLTVLGVLLVGWLSSVSIIKEKSGRFYERRLSNDV